MTLVRSQIVQTVRPGDASREYVVNDVFHTVDNSIVWGGPDYQNHADEILRLFAGQNTTSGATFLLYSNRALTVKVYDMADTKPRVPRAISSFSPSSPEEAALAPRDLACCLSYYAHNPGIKSERGRIYIGPWLQSEIFETVGASPRAMLTDLGHGLFDIGGENVAHVVHSPKKLTDTVVVNYWCNDVWDHMSSRRQREQARTKLAP
jgi:hypothetical protein